MLSILTCFAYPIYWFYKSWRDLSSQATKQENSASPALRQFSRISPLLRTIGLFVPILHIYLALSLMKGLAQLHPDTHSFPHRHPIMASVVITSLLIALLMLVMLPGTLYLLSFSASIPLAVAQSWLNAFWQSVESPSLEIRHMFSGRELIAIIIGSLLLGLILASPFLTT